MERSSVVCSATCRHTIHWYSQECTVYSITECACEIKQGESEMKFGTALSLALGSKPEKYLPPREAFLKEYGAEYEQEYVALSYHWSTYRRWAVFFGISSLSFFVVVLYAAMMMAAESVLSLSQMIGEWTRQFGPDTPMIVFIGLMILGAPLCAFLIGAGTILCIEYLLRIVGPARRARQRYMRCVWSHRMLVRAIILYNEAHPLPVAIC